MIDDSKRKVIIVGAGAAGLVAGITAARNGAAVILIEKNDRPGRKLRITGKGRCNVTNDCEIGEFMQSIPGNPRFMYAALNTFSPADAKRFFEELGVPLKTERGKRVFPVSDKAQDVVDALVKGCRAEGVCLVRSKVKSLILEEGRILGVKTEKEDIFGDAVIIATGGKSYPLTGSDGDGYTFAEQAGLFVTPLVPSLVPMVSKDHICKRMQGLSLKNVALTMTETQTGKVVYEDFGEMMFTHFGLTGPMILSASAHLRDVVPGKYMAYIDLKPALDSKMLDNRLLHDFSKYANRDFGNSLGELLPQKMIEIVVELSKIPSEKKVNSITKEERHTLCNLLKHFPVSVDGLRPIEEAIITRGGVDVKQIRPATMECKTVDNLYFAGEVLDVDGYTGGFNLQIAYSTAVCAGQNAAWGK